MQRTHSRGNPACRGPAPLGANPETFQGPRCGSRAFTALCVYGVGVGVSVAVAACLWARTGVEAGLLGPPRGPEVLPLALKAFNLLAPPRGPRPDVLGKDKPSRGCQGTLQPPHPSHQHRVNWTAPRPSPASQGLWPGIQSHSPTGPVAGTWQNSPLSCLVAFVEEEGAGLGIAVGHKPLNKAADANSCFFVISWVLGQAQGFSEGEGETEALRGGLAGHGKWGLVSPSNCPFCPCNRRSG